MFTINCKLYYGTLMIVLVGNVFKYLLKRSKPQLDDMAVPRLVF